MSTELLNCPIDPNSSSIEAGNNKILGRLTKMKSKSNKINFPGRDSLIESG